MRFRTRPGRNPCGNPGRNYADHRGGNRGRGPGEEPGGGRLEAATRDWLLRSLYDFAAYFGWNLEGFLDV